ncbi:hypothetical protein MPC4_270044 [Methylocella tundrae]|uniref:Uncharacterized protein n=1 Tax=Methylocella tundrae TaxID=227605 RepID=A0A8B6M6K7_METTU|nr:hypothetical protein MPC1_220002 [Methylocella tundrae]VTZ50683.1 hypothetical protein MPC4_270044 [Methylocella tundrae]
MVFLVNGSSVNKTIRLHAASERTDLFDAGHHLFAIFIPVELSYEFSVARVLCPKFSAGDCRSSGLNARSVGGLKGLGRAAPLSLGRKASLFERREQRTRVSRAFDAHFVSRWIGFDAGLWIDVLQGFCDGLGAAATGHVGDVEAKHGGSPDLFFHLLR